MMTRKSCLSESNRYKADGNFMDLLIFLKKKRLALDSEVSNFHVHLNIDTILHRWTKKELKLEQTGLKTNTLADMSEVIP